MKTNDVHPAFRNAMGFIEAFRRLGFPMNDVSISRNDDCVLLVTVRQAGNTMSCDCGVCDLEYWRDKWAELINAIAKREIPQLVVDEAYVTSRPCIETDAFLTSLRLHGIRPPAPLLRESA